MSNVEDFIFRARKSAVRPRLMGMRAELPVNRQLDDEDRDALSANHSLEEEFRHLLPAMRDRTIEFANVVVQQLVGHIIQPDATTRKLTPKQRPSSPLEYEMVPFWYIGKHVMQRIYHPPLQVMAGGKGPRAFWAVIPAHNETAVQTDILRPDGLHTGLEIINLRTPEPPENTRELWLPTKHVTPAMHESRPVTQTGAQLEHLLPIEGLATFGQLFAVEKQRQAMIAELAIGVGILS